MDEIALNQSRELIQTKLSRARMCVYLDDSYLIMEYGIRLMEFLVGE